MNESQKKTNTITYEELIKMELLGKNNAQGGYDSILWKIRSGYAILLYGSLSLIVTSVDKKIITITPDKTPVILSTLIIGFSFFIAFLDYYFLKCKIRVVDGTNKLMDMAFYLSSNKSLSEEQKHQLKILLHNSGESLEEIDWSKWNSRSPLLLYLLTAVFGIVIIHIISY